MLVTDNAVAIHAHSFERSIIFIPKWLDKRLEAFSKSDRTLKDIDGLLSILTPADVSLYLEQVSAVSRLPSVQPYFASFNTFSYLDSTSWGTNISAKRAAKTYNEVMEIVHRGREANNPANYSPNESYVENNTFGNGYAVVPQHQVNDQVTNDLALIASILGVDQHDESFDLLNPRVKLTDLDADTLVLRLEALDPFESAITQTRDNISKITQYYEFNKVMASPVGKFYSRMVLATPNT